MQQQPLTAQLSTPPLPITLFLAAAGSCLAAHTHTLQMLTGHVLPRLTNMSHIIHKVSFGPEYPGQVNPLDGFKRVNGLDDTPHAYKYFLKVRPQHGRLPT